MPTKNTKISTRGSNFFGFNVSGKYNFFHSYESNRSVIGSANTPITITMWGGGGGGMIFPGGSPTWGTPSPGGAGGSLVATGTYGTFNLNSGQSLYIYVGGGGAGGSVGGAGGPNGGHPGKGGSASPGTFAGGGGGGMSSLYLNGGFGVGTLMLIAAGGGTFYQFMGGYPDGFAPPSAPNTVNGKGGSQSAGGAAGTQPGYPSGNSGTQFTGADGASVPGGKSSGGGAGYYGGGSGIGDTGAANGGFGGGGSNYQNPSIFPAPSVVHANMFTSPTFNPPATPATYPYANPYLDALYSTNPAFPGTRSNLPGQNSTNPLYNVNYSGGSTVGGPGYPGSVHITIDGNVYSFTTVGTHVLILP